MREASVPLSPYKGVLPFFERDAAFFFGREHERKIISANLRTRRLTVLYGPSGVGKTSVINAGVVPHLRPLKVTRQTGGRPAPVTVLAGTGVGPEGTVDTFSAASGQLASINSLPIVVVFTSWIGDAQQSLQDVILANVRQTVAGLSIKTANRLRALTLSQMLEKLTSDMPGLELLIILDQFEEYFVYHPHDEGLGEFDDEFSCAVMKPDLHANFLVSIREDWLSRLDRFKGRTPNLFENSIRLEHLTRKAAREAIEKPIEKYNELIRRIGTESRVKRPTIIIERDFTTQALDQLVQLDEPGETSLNSREVELSDRLIQTSRLQLVLEYLWGKIKNEPQPNFGIQLLTQPDTIRHIFQLHLEESLASLEEKERIVAAHSLRFIITPSGKKFASTAKELANRCSLPPKEIAIVLHKLDETGVVNVVAPPPGHHYDETHYEIASDVLADAILDWVKLTLAQQSRRAAISRKTRTAFMIVLGILLMVIALALVNAIRQRRRLEAIQKELQVEQGKLTGALDVARKLDKNVAILIGHTDAVTSAVFTQDGHVLTASVDHSAILWDVNSKTKVQDFSKNETEEKPLVLASINPLGNLVVTASTDGIVRLWKVGFKEAPTQLRERVGQHVTDLSFSPLGDLLAASNTAGGVMIWNTASQNLIKNIPGNGKPIKQLSFSPTGTLLAVASEDHTIRVWKVSDWSHANVLEGHTDKVNGLAFSPDEQLIASAGADTTVRLWNLSNSSHRIFRGHTAGVNSVDFDPAGIRLLTSSDDTSSRVWDVETGKPIQLIGHTDKVLSASFSPSGLHAVTAGKDNNARIWSVSTGRVLVVLSGHSKEITHVSYSRDGKYVLTASDDATARVWSAPESGIFEIDKPTISASPYNHPGDCPVTIRFFLKITALSGSGTVIYRFRGSDGRTWPWRELTFDEPGPKYVNWYWRITADYDGFEAVEILEPKGIKEQKARFTVKCNSAASPTPEPQPTPSPPSTP